MLKRYIENLLSKAFIMLGRWLKDHDNQLAKHEARLSALEAQIASEQEFPSTLRMI